MFELWNILVGIIIIEGLYFVLADLIKHNGEMDFTHSIDTENIKWIKTDRYDRIKIIKDHNGQEYEEIIFFDNSFKKKIFVGYLSFNIPKEFKQLKNIYCVQVTYSELSPVTFQKNNEQELYFKLIGKEHKVETNSPHFTKQVIPVDSYFKEIKKDKVSN